MLLCNIRLRVTVLGGFERTSLNFLNAHSPSLPREIGFSKKFLVDS